MPFHSIPGQIFEHQTLLLEMHALSTKDCHDFHEFIQRNMENFRVPFPITTEAVIHGLEETRSWIERKRVDQSEGRCLMMLVRNRYTQEVIFVFSAFGFDWRVPKCEVAWMIDKDFEGMGIATVVVGKMLKYLFEVHELNKIICRIEPSNLKSEKLAQRLKFVREGTHVKDFRNGNDELVDVGYFGLWKT